jgi:hypothetical protein
VYPTYDVTNYKGEFPESLGLVSIHYSS